MPSTHVSEPKLKWEFSAITIMHCPGRRSRRLSLAGICSSSGVGCSPWQLPCRRVCIAYIAVSIQLRLHPVGKQHEALEHCEHHVRNTDACIKANYYFSCVHVWLMSPVPRQRAAEQLLLKCPPNSRTSTLFHALATASQLHRAKMCGKNV